MYNGSEALGKHSFLFNHFWPLQFFCSRGLFILYIFLYTSSNTFSASNRSPWAPGGGILDQDFIHYSLVFQQEVWNSQHLSNTGYLRRGVTQLLTRENYRIELRPAWHNYFTPCGQFGKLAAGRVLQITNSAHQWLPPPPPPATIPLSWEELLIKMLSTVTHE